MFAAYRIARGRKIVDDVSRQHSEARVNGNQELCFFSRFSLLDVERFTSHGRNRINSIKATKKFIHKCWREA